MKITIKEIIIEFTGTEDLLLAKKDWYELKVEDLIKKYLPKHEDVVINSRQTTTPKIDKVTEKIVKNDNPFPKAEKQPKQRTEQQQGWKDRSYTCPVCGVLYMKNMKNQVKCKECINKEKLRTKDIRPPYDTYVPKGD